MLPLKPEACRSHSHIVYNSYSLVTVYFILSVAYNFLCCLVVFYPHFNIIDMATGRRSRYIGNYTLRVVFTATEAQAVPDRFTNVEIHEYNNLNRFVF